MFAHQCELSLAPGVFSRDLISDWWRISQISTPKKVQFTPNLTLLSATLDENHDKTQLKHTILLLAWNVRWHCQDPLGGPPAPTRALADLSMRDPSPPSLPKVSKSPEGRALRNRVQSICTTRDQLFGAILQQPQEVAVGT